MNDINIQDSPLNQSSRGFIKGPRRASFSPTSPPPAEVPDPPVSDSVPVPQSGAGAAPEQVSPAQPQQTLVQPQAKVPVKKGGKLVLFGLLGILVATVSVVSFKMYWDSQQKLAKLQTANPEIFTEFETDALVAKVARHMILPNEKPLINTVSEVEKLRGEPFYAQAQNGDKVLVFSRRAILYSPAQDRVVEIGFIRATTPTPVAENPPQASESGDQASEQGSVAGASTHQPKVLLDTTSKDSTP